MTNGIRPDSLLQLKPIRRNRGRKTGRVAERSVGNEDQQIDFNIEIAWWKPKWDYMGVAGGDAGWDEGGRDRPRNKGKTGRTTDRKEKSGRLTRSSCIRQVFQLCDNDELRQIWLDNKRFS